MIVHIFPDQKFTIEFCKFIESTYSDNLILIYKDSNESFCENLKIDNCLVYGSIKLLLKSNAKTIKNADKIIVHSLDDWHLYFFLYSNKKILSKAVFVAWGGDIYNDYIATNGSILRRTIRPIKTIVKNILGKKYVIGHFKQYMTFAYADYDYMKAKYKAKGKSFDCLYPSTINKQDLDNGYQGNKTNRKRILVGNSATETNNHFDAFNVLSNYKEHDIDIICPLSYGDEDYRDKVIAEGIRVFGIKFHPVIEYLSPQNYSKLLSTIDIAVFYHDRQQATGNIEILAYYGAKVFIKSTITTWKHYVDRDGRYFFDALNIQNMSYDEFICFDKEEKKDNTLYFSKIWDLNYIKSKWDPILLQTV